MRSVSIHTKTERRIYFKIMLYSENGEKKYTYSSLNP